jgi:hypothetical protein
LELNDYKLDDGPSDSDSDPENRSKCEQSIKIEVEELNGLKEQEGDGKELNEKRLYELQLFDWERCLIGNAGDSPCRRRKPRI